MTRAQELEVLNGCGQKLSIVWAANSKEYFFALKEEDNSND